MPAAIANNGSVDLFASHREPAWHGLGNVFTETVTDYRVMLEKAGLADWNLRQIPVEVPGADRFAVPAYGTVATVGGENVVLGICGERREEISNEAGFAFLQSISDGSRWETAGAIKDCRIVFGSMALETDFVLDPTGVADVVKSYLLLWTGHDGSTGLGGGRTKTRVVCQNTLNVAMGNVSDRFKIRHTASAEERMREVARIQRDNLAYDEAFETEAKALFEAPATDKQYFSIVEEMFPKPEKDVKGAMAKWEKRQEVFSQAWKGAPNAGIRGTAWGVFNALTEANQWGRNVRAGAKGAENFAAAGAGFDIPTNAFRAKALTMAKSLV